MVDGHFTATPGWGDSVGPAQTDGWTTLQLHVVGVIAATPPVHRASRIGGQQHHHREGIDGRLDESVVLIEALRDFVLGVNEEDAYPYRRRDFHCLEDEMLEKSRPETSTLVLLVDPHPCEQQGGNLLGLAFADRPRSGRAENGSGARRVEGDHPARTGLRHDPRPRRPGLLVSKSAALQPVVERVLSAGKVRDEVNGCQ